MKYERVAVEIDLRALRANAEAVMRTLRTDLRAVFMVKGDAYGCGAPAVVRTLSALRPWGFGVATLEEAEAITGLLRNERILIFGPRTEQMTLYANPGFRAVVNDVRQAMAWPFPYHLEFDTGLSRTGVPWDLDDEAVERLAMDPNLEGVCTHLGSTMPTQISRFGAIVSRIRAVRPPEHRPLHVHYAASDALVDPRHRDVLSEATLVRPGSLLYGGREHYRAVMHVRSYVASVRTVKRFTPIGYGFDAQQLDHEVRVATVPMGYGDGLAGGGRLPARFPAGELFTAAVCMDYCMFILPEVWAGVADVQEGDPVDFLSSSLTAPYVERTTGVPVDAVLHRYGSGARSARTYRY